MGTLFHYTEIRGKKLCSKRFLCSFNKDLPYFCYHKPARHHKKRKIPALKCQHPRKNPPMGFFKKPFYVIIYINYDYENKYAPRSVFKEDFF
jgi:hypothetical protein